MASYEDFLPTCNINQGTTFPILPVRCDCGRRMGALQRKIEHLIGTNLRKYEHEDISDSDKLSKARIDMLNEMGFVKSCCKKVVTLYPFSLFNDIEGEECNVDCTYVDASSSQTSNHYMGYNETEIGMEFFPKSKKTLGFNEDLYCIQLYSIVTGISSEDIYSANSKVKGNGEKTYPKFPKLKAKRIHYPKTVTEHPVPEF